LTDWRSLALPTGCLARRTLQYRAMTTASTKFAGGPERSSAFNPGIKFGTSGWRALIGDEFTFASVRLATAGIAEHVLSRRAKPTILVGYDTRFYSEEFSCAAADVLTARGVRVLLCDAAAPTPAIACEILRRKADGAINFTASHNPAEYHGLKFSSADGGPALPEVTQDIEARVAKLAAKLPAQTFGAHETAAFAGAGRFEKISPREPYLKRLGELVNFEKIRAAKLAIVYDALHGCGAGYLDGALAGQGIECVTLRANRDVLFDGSGPDVSEENLAPLKRAVIEQKAAVGLATDGDADRFGIFDAGGAWISPNHILALLYDYLVETRGWKLPAARSVATTHLLDAVARHHGQTIHQTPVGFKYVGELIKQDKIALGGEESSGLTIRGHVPEKDGILACLLVAEMIAHRRATLAEQIRALFQRVGVECWPLRENLRLSDEVKARTMARLNQERASFAGRKIEKTDRTDGVKWIFSAGSWVLMRLSGTEPLLRLYTEASSPEASAELARAARAWIFE
jgi:phosphoglucomutase